jgi:hypothetical protein
MINDDCKRDDKKPVATGRHYELRMTLKDAKEEDETDAKAYLKLVYEKAKEIREALYAGRRLRSARSIGGAINHN